jgi:pimeloyl-ACP methyl ester carboxylesterase
MSFRELNDDDGENEDTVRTGPLGLNQLHAPSDAVVELVFVHGLGGGSRKSWSLTKHVDHFWPKSWLPHDPDFQNVGIHSFGYRSAKTEVAATIAAIPEFAAALLAALHDTPAIRQSQSAIVLVGHSMGGLVIKKASTVVSSQIIP